MKFLFVIFVSLAIPLQAVKVPDIVDQPPAAFFKEIQNSNCKRVLLDFEKETLRKYIEEQSNHEFKDFLKFSFDYLEMFEDDPFITSVCLNFIISGIIEYDDEFWCLSDADRDALEIMEWMTTYLWN